MRRGRFIVIDGIDGSGKSTQVRMLKKKLGRRAVCTHDPGGTPTGEAIRKIVLGSRTLSPLAVFFLYLSSRAALVEEVIAPALRKGRIVISDRFDSSTYAYQVHAGKHPEYEPVLRSLAEGILASAVPEAYIILDSDPVKARKRLFAGKRDDLNAYDRKPLSYHRKVREGYKKFRPKGAKVFFIDADRTPEAVHRDVWEVVKRILDKTVL